MVVSDDSAIPTYINTFPILTALLQFTFSRFWEIRTFYIEALHIPSSELRNTTWADVLVKLKQAQRDHKMNIQKQELTELDVYHRILRFKNYMVAMVNKNVLPCKIKIPFYGDKVFFTQGLKFNFELLLFCEFTVMYVVHVNLLRHSPKECVCVCV